jgi:hypothetical protein
MNPVLVNGSTPPTLVADGDIITISINPNPTCTILEQKGPTCVMPFFYRISGNKIIINPKMIGLIKNKLAKRKKE